MAGSGDALQVNGPVFITDSLIVGDGDTILGRGPAFFNRSELQSNGVFMWVRNTAANHGNVLLDCTFRKRGTGVTELARAPINNGRAYPNAEAVLIDAKLEGISPVGWGAMGGAHTGHRDAGGRLALQRQGDERVGYGNQRPRPRRGPPGAASRCHGKITTTHTTSTTLAPNSNSTVARL